MTHCRRSTSFCSRRRLKGDAVIPSLTATNVPRPVADAPRPVADAPRPVADAPRPVIVIFGAAMWPGGVPSPALRRRVQAALRLGATLQRPLYMPTGGVGRHPPSEASAMAAMLRAAGVEDGCIRIEDTALDTTDSVFACRRLLLSETLWEIGPVYAATSLYHLPRCVILLRLAGIAARPCPPIADPDRWWMRLFRIGREAVALVYDVGVVLWHRPGI